MKQQAMLIAFKEQAMRAAFQEAEIKTLEDSLEKKGFSSSESILSFFHPYIQLETRYDENIFLTDARRDDFVNTVSPGIKFGIGRMEAVSDVSKVAHRFELDFGVDNFYYLRHTNLNREEPYLGIDFLLGKGQHKLRLRHNYNATSALVSSINVGESGIARYDRNTTEVEFEIARKRLGVDLGYDRNSNEYKKEFKEGSSTLDQTIIVKGFFQAYPKTRFFGEYNYQMYEYSKYIDNSLNFQTHKFWVGATGDFTKKTRGNLKLGFEIRKNKDGSSAEGTTVDADLSYKYSPKTSFLFKANKGIQDTGYVSEGFDETYGYSLGCYYTLNRKVSFNIDFLNFVHDKYNSGRKDDSFSTSLAMAYTMFKWWKFLLRYSHMERSSSEMNAGYIDNVYSLNTRVEF